MEIVLTIFGIGSLVVYCNYGICLRVLKIKTLVTETISYIITETKQVPINQLSFLASLDSYFKTNTQFASYKILSHKMT